MTEAKLNIVQTSSRTAGKYFEVSDVQCILCSDFDMLWMRVQDTDKYWLSVRVSF